MGDQLFVEANKFASSCGTWVTVDLDECLPILPSFLASSMVKSSPANFPVSGDDADGLAVKTTGNCITGHRRLLAQRLISASVQHLLHWSRRLPLLFPRPSLPRPGKQRA